MNYQPLNDYVLVKTIKEEEKTKGGLQNHQTQKNK